MAKRAGSWQKADVTTPSPSPDGLFSAFRHEEHRRRWPWVIAVAAAVMVAAVLFVTLRTARFQVVTEHGIRVIDSRMRAPEVEHLLGRPIAPDPALGDGCLRYGRPKMEKPFPLYSVCYAASGKVSNVTQREYEAQKVEPAR